MRLSVELTGRPPRVLIVDDELHNRQLLEVMLGPEGVVLQSAASGEAALAMMAAEPPDLVLLDVMMPGIDGYHVAAKIKGNRATANIPVILITALDDHQSRMFGLTAGAEDFLTKPIDRVELCARVRNLLRLKAYGDYHDHYSQMLEGEVTARTADLLHERERTQIALQNANVGIWDLDYTTRLARWSEIMEAQFGLQPGTFGGTFEDFIALVHPEDRESVVASVRRAVTSGEDFSYEHRTTWPDGSVHWLRGAGRILLGEHGEPRRGVGIYEDVSERRTLMAQNEQLQKMEAIGRLAGGVAHDFNNLLTVILGFCELLLTDLGTDDPRHADIAEIEKAGARGAGLTRQLLAFSRKQIIEPTLLDLNAVVAGMQVMLGRLIGEDVKVVVVLRPNLALVTADRGQVEQVVMNLAVNARDAMPTGGTLTIETANVELDEHYAAAHLGVTPGPYVGLTVTDTGTGMTPEVQARLFEPFFTTKEAGKGTGLGMATVYGIVMRGGGSVGVYSEPGKGTAFKVFLPQVETTGMVVDTPAPVARPHTGTQTVMLVEDEGGLRDLVTRLLQRQGYTVLAAADAEEAQRLFEANPSIDVLLTDVVMPGSSGPELTRRLIEQRPGLRVIYMSGYTEEAIVHHGVIKPGIAFLNKPFTSEALGEKIREALDR
jgi:two-component system, cell cycle sensor histidine kinase and response regulator CckA